MNKNKTKSIRKIIQIGIFVLLFLILILYNLYTSEFLDFKLLSIGDMNPYGGWNALKEYLTDSSYEFEGISKSIALTIALVVMAIVGGRFFCGWICPIGAIQDFSTWVGSKMGIKRFQGIGKRNSNPLFFKYPILLTILLLSIFGYGAIIAELSPWRALLSITRLPMSWKDIAIGIIILIVISILSMFISRFFCRYLCPLGAAQTLFSSLSLLTLKYSMGCSHCNRCLNECPMGIKLSSKEDSMSAECIRCMKCVDNCKITTDISLGLKMGKRNISSKAYAALAMSIFFVVWLGMPNLWGGSFMVSNIAFINLKDGVYEGEAKGFAGKIVTEIRIEEGKLTDIKIIDHHETKGWYEEVFMTLPKEIMRKQRIEADAISGATKTSKGFIKSVESAVKKAVDTAI